MEHIQKTFAFNTSCIIIFFLLVLAPCRTSADTSSSSDSTGQLAPGYSEQFTFKVNGQVVGGQTATLNRIDGGLQTWSFAEDIVVPVNGQILNFQQSGSFVVDSSAHVISYDTIIVTNGDSQSEKIIVGNRGASVEFNPEIPSVDHTFPIFGRPYLLVNNLVTPLSLATRANHANGSGPFLLPVLSANYLRQVVIEFKPETESGWIGRHFNVYQGTLYVPGEPDSTFEYWLSPSNGEIDHCFNRAQKLEIIRN